MLSIYSQKIRLVSSTVFFNNISDTNCRYAVFVVVSCVPKFDYEKISTIIQVSVVGPDLDPDGSAFILVG
jgi:hypothetical protein